MTAICGGGTSAPKSGLPSVIDPAITLIAELLSARGGKWVAGALGFQLINPLDLSTFCAGDPPALPTFTSDETNAILQLQFGADFVSGMGKLKDWVQHVLWYEFCECTSGTLDTYVAPAMPAGTPVYQPPAGGAATPCNVFTYTSGACDTGNVNKGGPVYTSMSAPPTSFVCELIGTQCGTVGAGTWNWAITQVTAAGDAHTTNVSFFNPTESHTVTILAVPGVLSLRLNHNQGSGPSGQSIAGSTISAYCGGQSPGGLQPCCPPDEATQASLDLILKMVTLIQRQQAPFAYVYGDNHTGLSGDGELAVSGLLGVSVDVTTTPNRAGRTDGTPETLFDVGYVSLGTADGWLTSRRIDHDGTLFIPPLGGIYTRVGYTVPADVVVAIRELVREP